jgi:hypothetical protein
MYGDAAYSSMALELNASDARGIDVRSLNLRFVDECMYHPKLTNYNYR